MLTIGEERDVSGEFLAATKDRSNVLTLHAVVHDGGEVDLVGESYSENVVDDRAGEGVVDLGGDLWDWWWHHPQLRSQIVVELGGENDRWVRIAMAVVHCSATWIKRGDLDLRVM